MEKMGAAFSLAIALFLLFGMLLDVDTRLMGIIGIAGVVVLVGVYELRRKAPGQK